VADVISILIGEPQVAAGSAVAATVNFRTRSTASASTPSSIRYRVDCLTSKRQVINWTSVSAASSVSITIPGTSNGTIDSSNDLEQRQITVEADTGLSTQVKAAATWKVRTIRGYGLQHTPLADLLLEPYYPITAAEISAGVVPTSYQYQELIPNRYGTNTTPGTTDMTAAVQAALNVAAVNGGQVRLLPEVYLCTDNLDVNVGDGETVDIVGTGWANGGILFSGASVTTGVTYTGSAFEYAGTIEHLRVRCQSGAKRCVTFIKVNQPRVLWCRFQGAAGAAAYFDSTLMALFEHTLVTGSGSATEGSVEVEGTVSVGTTFRWLHSYISGKHADSAVGGLIINRTTIVNIDGGAIESCGTPIKICTKSDSTGNLYRQFHIHNIDLENPGSGNPYIDIGSGLSAGGLVVNIEVNSVDATPSGTATVPYFLRANNFTGLSVHSTHFTLGAAPTSCFELGSFFSGAYIQPHRNLSSLAVTWVRVNGTQVKAAGPRLPWNSEDCARGLVGRTSIQNLTGATPSILVSSTMGGYYGCVTMTNGGATTVTSLSDGEIGMEIELSATNGNTTLTHGTGSGQFFCVGAANLLLTANLVYRFRHNGTYWAQVTG
jgi:hypothetical protein